MPRFPASASGVAAPVRVLLPSRASEAEVARSEIGFRKGQQHPGLEHRALHGGLAPASPRSPRRQWSRPFFGDPMSHSECPARKDACEIVSHLLGQLGRASGVVERPHDVSPESRQEYRGRFHVHEESNCWILLGNFAGAREPLLGLAEIDPSRPAPKTRCTSHSARANAVEVDARCRVVSDESHRLRIRFLCRVESPERCMRKNDVVVHRSDQQRIARLLRYT